MRVTLFKERSPEWNRLTSNRFILLGILISYLPQHVRIITRRSSLGISPYFVLLGTTSGTFAFANVVTLPPSRANLGCCRMVSGFECFAAILGIAQIGVQWACFVVMYRSRTSTIFRRRLTNVHSSFLLFLIFFPRATSAARPTDSLPPSPKTALAVALGCIVHGAVTLILILYFSYAHTSLLSQLSYTFGVLATLLAAIQFLPQIYTTWRLQAVGSLSIPMMCIQTPGSFVWVGSLSARFGWAGWSTWGIYLVTGCLQGWLLVMSIWFEVRDRRQKGRSEARRDETDQNTPDDRTRLLGGGLS